MVSAEDAEETTPFAEPTQQNTVKQPHDTSDGIIWSRANRVSQRSLARNFPYLLTRLHRSLSRD